MEVNAASDDASERSPMPLNVRPPEPTKIQIEASKSIFGSEKDASSGSVPLSLPERPSGYSPPPSSVFSEEDDFFPQSIQKSRPPLTEVHLEDDTADLSLREFTTPFPISRPTPQSFAGHRSTVTTPAATVDPRLLTPMIRHIKSDLHESQQTLYLLQEENKALNADNKQLDATVQEHSQRIQKLETELLNKEDQWSSAVEMLESEKKAQEEVNAKLQEEIKSLLHVKDQLAAVVKEKEVLQRKLDSVKADSKNSLASNESLQSTVQQLESELIHEKDRAEAAESQRLALFRQLDESQAEKERLTTLIQKKDTMYDELQQQNQAVKQELQMTELRLSTETSQASHNIRLLETELASLQEEMKQGALTNKSLDTQLQALRKEMTEKAQNRTDSACQTDRLGIEIGTQTTAESSSIPALIMPSHSFASATAGDGCNITERLSRIRDAADRATIMQEVRREVSRLKSEHETAMRKMEQEHDAALHRVIHDAKTELRSKTEKQKERLRSEYEAKLEALEIRHQAELEEAKEECERTNRISEETVKAAVAEVEVAVSQLQTERTKVQELEEKLSSFELIQEERSNRLAIADLESLRHEWQNGTAVLLERIRSACETIFEEHVSEKMNDHLLPMSKSFPPTNMRQSEGVLSPLAVGDGVFTWSPREYHPHPSKRQIGDQNVFRRKPEINNPPMGLASKSFQLTQAPTNLDETLAETEAIVMRLMSTDFDGS